MAFLSRVPRAAAQSLRRYATVADVSGVKVAGSEVAPAATSSITVVVKAGSRYETKPGVAHCLKSFAFKSTSAGSALKTARETELYGGVLSASLSREHLFLTAEFLRGDEKHFLDVLAAVLSSTHYYPHEYAELVLPTVHDEARIALSDPTSLALDVAHQIAFRRGLGNSLYASPYSPVTSADVKSFAQQAFAKGNIAVLGTGIETDQLAKAVQSSFGSGSGSSSLQPGSSSYFGGEQRLPLDVHGNGQPTMVIAYGSTNSSADLAALPHLFGGEPSVKWSTGASPLAQAAGKVPGASVKSFTLPYSDASLFGVIVSAPTSQGLASVAKDVGATLKGFKAKDEDVKRAVAKAKFAEASLLERPSTYITSAASGLFSGKLAAAASFDKVSASSIGKAAEELFKGKPTVVAIGDLAVLPYSDELGL